MLKLRRAFRRFAGAARLGAVVLLFAGPVSAYTMDDYYNQLRVVEQDNWMIADLEGTIQSARNQIDSANNYYDFLYRQCTSNWNAGLIDWWYQVWACQDSIAMEWQSVIAGYEADISGAETGLWIMYPILSNDLATLDAIKAELGIVD